MRITFLGRNFGTTLTVGSAHDVEKPIGEKRCLRLGCQAGLGLAKVRPVASDECPGKRQNVVRSFAQRRNVFSPSHLSLLLEIVRFNREAPKLLDVPNAEELTLLEFLRQGQYSQPFIERYLYPMASAIWSAGWSRRSTPSWRATIIPIAGLAWMRAVACRSRWARRARRGMFAGEASWGFARG